jgi:hypothetical protein
VGSHWFGEVGSKAPRRWSIEPNLQPYISKISQILSTSLLVQTLGDILALSAGIFSILMRIAKMMCPARSLTTESATHLTGGEEDNTFPHTSGSV